MNRISRDSLGTGRNAATTAQQHRRGRSITGISKDRDENLDLFSRNRLSRSIASSEESDVSTKLGRISVGSVRLPRSGMEDLLSSTDGGKHDYDWLLTPPGTPLFSSPDANEPQPSVTAPRSNSAVRSASTTKASRLSTTQTENGHSTRPVRSSSVTRPSISSTYSSYSNRTSTSVLNTSSASVNSSRPSTPSSRSTLPAAVRSSLVATRSAPVRSSTPAKTRPQVSTSGEKTRPSPSLRPSTPTSRPQMSVNLTSPVARSNSRPSTPTRRNPTPALSPVNGRSSSVGRAPPINGRSSVLPSRPSSPGPRARAPPQPIVPPDFPLDAPPNLRTTLPDRPVSAGRSRPGSALTASSNSDAAGPANPVRRQSSSPVVARGRLPELSGRTRSNNNGHEVRSPELQKPTSADSLVRRPAKPATSLDSTGFGRTISKKSLDMALRHMDIRHSVGGILYPQSIRTNAPKSRPAGRLPESLSSTGSNGTISENSNGADHRSPDQEVLFDNDKRAVTTSRASDLDLYGSSRYDAILLKEDSKNTNWLHSIDDVSDQSPVFDHRFEPLPEPFGLL